MIGEELRVFSAIPHHENLICLVHDMCYCSVMTCAWARCVQQSHANC